MRSRFLVLDVRLRGYLVSDVDEYSSPYHPFFGQVKCCFLDSAGLFVHLMDDQAIDGISKINRLGKTYACPGLWELVVLVHFGEVAVGG